MGFRLFGRLVGMERLRAQQTLAQDRMIALAEPRRQVRLQRAGRLLKGQSLVRKEPNHADQDNKNQYCPGAPAW